VSEVVNRRYEEDEGRDTMTGQTLPRTWIREAIRDCYLFLKFDAYGPEVFDLDARFASWSEHASLGARSVAGETYQELVRVRQATLAHYQTCAEAISSLRYGESYDPSDARVRLAFRLKDLAWNHFNIFNYYDADRYMARAADLLRTCVETNFFNRPRDKA
jgi:hypothetical protein